MKRHLAMMLAWVAMVPPAGTAATSRYFAVWGKGSWVGTLQVVGGRVVKVSPYSFEPQYGDRFTPSAEDIHWVTGVSTGADGITFTVESQGTHTIRLGIGDETISVADSELAEASCRVFRPTSNNPEAVVIGQGDVRHVPESLRTMEQPIRYRPPQVPSSVLALPDDWGRKALPLLVHLAAATSCELRARRCGRDDGRLYLELGALNGELPALARIALGDWQRNSPAIQDGRLWLSLRPRIGSLVVRVIGSDGSAAETTVPTTLVETRESRLFVNGEPFLIKGTLPRDMPDSDGAFLKALGANTVRVRDVTVAEKHQFMAIAVTHQGPSRICEADTCPSDDRFFDAAGQYLDHVRERAPWAASSPNTLIVQLGNEQIMGADPWQKFFADVHPIERLDWLLASARNIAKPLAPMLPLGYSNCAFGYRAPTFLDVYLHNTYLSRDRDWPPLPEFMEFQGCDRRPYIHTEFGANRYMPQACIGGGNSPVLEKIHAWNYPNRWAEYDEAGTSGGTCYCMYDYDPATVGPESWDRGFTNFGIMTLERKPKLACWELWHMWRDFELTPTADSKALALTYSRGYWARNTVLTLEDTSGMRTVAIGEVPPNGNRTLPLPSPAPWIRWQVDYTTHGGLPMVAMGVWPPERERDAFLSLMRERETFAFLRELMDAEVVCTDGTPAPRTLKEMEMDDQTIVVCFKKPDGGVYLTCFSSRRPKNGHYHENIDIDLAFSGTVERVDEWTGALSAEPVLTDVTPAGLRIRGVRVPHISPSYSHRSRQPIRIPVFRITPKAARSEDGRALPEAPTFAWRILRPPMPQPVRELPKAERCVVNIWVAVPGQKEALVSAGESLRGLGKLKQGTTRDRAPALNCRGHVGSSWQQFSFTFKAVADTAAELRLGGQRVRPSEAVSKTADWLEKYALLDDIALKAGQQTVWKTDFGNGLADLPGARLEGAASLTRSPDWVRSGRAAAAVSYSHYLAVPISLSKGETYTVTAWYRAKPDGLDPVPQTP